MGFRNRLINGDMRINQRGLTSLQPVPAYVVHVCDRWQVGGVAGRASTQLNHGGVAPPPGFKSYIGVVSVSSGALGATQAIEITQVIEGFNCADLDYGTASAKPVTLGFWARCSQTGSVGFSLATVPIISGSASVRSYPTSFTITAANTWEFKTITVPGDTFSAIHDTGNGPGLYFRFMFCASSDLLGTANTWQTGNPRAATGSLNLAATNGATLYVTGAQLEAGSAASPFERRPVGLEFALCQRYYQSGSMGGYSTTAYIGSIAPLMVQMRSSPTVTFNDQWLNNAKVNTSAGTNVTIAAGGITASANHLMMDAILAASAANWWRINYTVTAEL
jgi:hypothetical protein